MNREKSHHFQEGDGGEGEKRSFQPETEMTDAEADDGGKHRADEHAEPWGKVVVLQEQRGSIGANTVIDRVPQRKLTGVTAEDVPGGRKRAVNTYRDEHVHDKGRIDERRNDQEQR